jgi:hypothetical protein
VGVDPEHAADPADRGEPAERAERDRVVAAEDERGRADAGLLRDRGRDPGARLLDLGQEARALVAERRRLRHRRRHVPVVADREAKAP